MMLTLLEHLVTLHICPYLKDTITSVSIPHSVSWASVRDSVIRRRYLVVIFLLPNLSLYVG